MTKQTKKQICDGKATVAYYSGMGGLEAKHIEYGINDYMYLVSGTWHGKRAYHRLKIRYGAKSCYVCLAGRILFAQLLPRLRQKNKYYRQRRFPKMSYTIMYDRQFLKTSRGIIPLSLYGDNNVTERVNGHERRERHWGVYANGKTEFSPNEYMSLIQSRCGSEFQEHFVSHGKWVDDKGIVAWAKNGIKNALTIEEIRKIIPVQSITCYISVWEKDYSHKTEEWRYCNTTEQLEQWLDTAYARKKELSADPSRDVFICLSYLRQEPLKLAARKEPEGEVIIRKENRYLSEVTDKGYTFSSNIADALVFKSTAEARNLAARSGQPFLYKARFICADNKFTVKDYRIKAILPEYPNGVYILRLTRNALRFCHESKYALKFATEQQARKYIAKLGNRFQRVINYSVVQAEEA